MANRRQGWIALQGGICAECGSTDRLEVDHKDRATKLCNPSNIWSRNAAFRAAELAKCQVLCYGCHKEKTVLETPEWMGAIEHGTNSKYSKGCRCVSCTNAHKEAAKAVRAIGGKW